MTIVMRIRDELRAALPWCAIALVVACQRSATEESVDSGLVVTAAEPGRAIEAHYREGAHALILRARADGPRVTSEIVDDRGHSITQLASSIVDHSQTRAPDGTRSVPVAALLANTAQLHTALRLSRHGLRQLRDAIGSDAADSAAFRQLSEQTALLHKALRETRLALLQEWGSEARRHLTLTPEEHTTFFAILNRKAVEIAARPGQHGRSAGVAATPEAELAALLGPERYARYQTRRKAWLAPAGDDALEVMP
jgi:hypothetical protein